MGADAARRLGVTDRARAWLVTGPLGRRTAFAIEFSLALGMQPAGSAIVPLVLGGNDVTLAASAALLEAGLLVTAIRPPTVPVGTARLRFTFSAAHSADDVAAVVAALRRLASFRR